MHLQRLNLHLTKNKMCLHQTHQSADTLLRNQVQGMGTVTDRSCLQKTTAVVATARQHWNTAHAVRYTATQYSTFELQSLQLYLRGYAYSNEHQSFATHTLQFNKGKAHTHQQEHTSHEFWQFQLYSLCTGNVNKAKVITLSERNPYK